MRASHHCGSFPGGEPRPFRPESAEGTAALYLAPGAAVTMSNLNMLRIRNPGVLLVERRVPESSAQGGGEGGLREVREGVTVWGS